MEKKQQEEIIKTAMELEKYIANCKHELSNPPPEPPICDEIPREYPEIKAKIKYAWLIAILPLIVCIALALIVYFIPRMAEVLIVFLGPLLFIGLIWIPVYYFAIYRRMKRNITERIRNSAKYQKKCAALDAEYDKMQEEAENKYKKQMEEYEADTLQKYKIKIEKVRNDLKAAQTNIENLYSDTNIIPKQYRSVDALQYLYDIISTSTYDIDYAISSYDKNRLRKLEEAKLNELQQTNQLINEQNIILQEQNDLLYEQNEISSKTRRDANIAAAAGIIQRQKILKSRNQ